MFDLFTASQIIHRFANLCAFLSAGRGPDEDATSVRAKLYNPLLGFRRAFARRSVAVSHRGQAGGTRTVLTLSYVIGHLDARRISTASWECGPLGSERPLSGSGA